MASCSVDVISSPLSSVALESEEDFVFVGNSHPNKLLEGLNRLRLNNVFCDVTLCCGGQEFPGHRNVLASFSSYFEAMFTTELMESKQESVSISGVEPEMMGLLFNYAYTSEVVISTSNVQALLAASHLLNVTAVQEACCQYMERHMDEKNCVAILGLAETYYCEKLEKRSMDYIIEHFSDVYQQEEFLSLCVDKLIQILASDDLNVPREDTVFEAAMMWLNKCPSTRRQSFQKVLEIIRLPLIRPSYLHDVIECLDVVKESQGCQRLISEARNQDVLPRWSTVPEVMVMAGGEDYEEEEMIDTVVTFDPLANQWSTLCRLPLAVSRHGLVVSGSTTLYLSGGELSDGSFSRQMWRYDCLQDSWLELAPMNTARTDHGLVMLDGYVFAVGGADELMHDMRVDSVERYDPSTDTWQLFGTVGIPDMHSILPGMAALDGLIYVIVGSCEKEVYTYNPNSSVWTEVAPRRVERSGSAVCTLKGKIYVLGGRKTSEYTDKVECYNPETNRWTVCAPMKRNRCWPGVAVVNRKIYVVGGEDVDWQTFSLSNIDTIERYCEETNTWEIVGEIAGSRYRRGSCRCASLRMRRDEL